MSIEFKIHEERYMYEEIPGGIPSRLVNGLCIKKNDYSEEEL